MPVANVMTALRVVLVAALVLGNTSCIPFLQDEDSRRGPEDFEVTGTLTRHLEGCSTTYELSNTGDPAPSCYKCTKFQTGSASAPLAFSLTATIASTNCEQALGLGSTPIGFSYTDSGVAIHMFDWNEAKSFAAWKDLGEGQLDGDEYIGTVTGSNLEDPVTRADSLDLSLSWSVENKLSLALDVCPAYEGDETEVPYSWLGDGGCDPQLNCAVYAFDGGDCEGVVAGDDDDATDPPQQCEDDELEDNDTSDDAGSIPAGGIQGLRACAGDPDYFILPALAGQGVQVDVTFNHAAGDIDVRLFDRDLHELTQGTSADDNETLWWTAESDGPLYIEVFLFDQFGGNVYGIDAWAN